MSEPIVIAALSGRALAAAARRAGYDPVVLDLFGDADTRQLASDVRVVEGQVEIAFEPESLIEAMAEFPAIPLVYGTGFEHCPSLLKIIAEGRPLYGNIPEVLERIKDPARFFGLLDGLQIPHPPTQLHRPANPEGWLAKGAGASGGGHIGPAAEDLSGDGKYYQQRIDAEDYSIQFLADGREARVLGFARQWRAPGQGYAFGGLVGPVAIDPAMTAKIEQKLSLLMQFVPLKGLQNADFLLQKDEFWLLEVNPRPAISLDCFDCDPKQPLFAAHIRACEGFLPENAPILQGARACSVVYARRPLTLPEAIAWPDWLADRPIGGGDIAPGMPVCTTLAQADTAAQAEALVKARGEAVLAALEAGRTRFDDREAA